MYNLESQFAEFVRYYANKFPKVFDKLFEYWWCIAQASRRNYLWREVVLGVEELSRFDRVCVIVVGFPVVSEDLACTIKPIIINNKPVYTIAINFTEFFIWRRVIREIVKDVIDPNSYTLSTLMHEYFHFPSPYREIPTHREFYSMYRTIMSVCPSTFWTFVFEINPLARYGVNAYELASKLYPRIIHATFHRFIRVLTSFELLEKLKSLGLVHDICFKSPKPPKLI